VRTPHLTWPVEVEVALLWLLMCHLVLGILFDLYNRIVWFDKVLHRGAWPRPRREMIVTRSAAPR
jgi:hypothetical protein